MSKIPRLWYANATCMGLWECRNRRTFAPVNLFVEKENGKNIYNNRFVFAGE